MPRRTERTRKTALAVAVLAAALTGSGAAAAADPATEAQAWRSAFERRQAVPLDERMIVVLAAPSLADRMAAPGKLSAKEQRPARAPRERVAGAAPRRASAQGIRVEREQVFTRTLNGFSASLGARAIAALESAPGVAGIYPVRAVYPASLSASALERPELLGRHGIALPGADGSGVTVAVLDTGIDRAHPSLRGRVLFGVDLVEGDTHAEPEPRPDDPHGGRDARNTRRRHRRRRRRAERRQRRGARGRGASDPRARLARGAGRLPEHRVGRRAARRSGARRRPRRRRRRRGRCGAGPSGRRRAVRIVPGQPGEPCGGGCARARHSRRGACRQRRPGVGRERRDDRRPRVGSYGAHGGGCGYAPGRA